MSLVSNPITKECKKCGEVKNITAFDSFKNKTGVGVRHVCRPCRKWKSPKGYWKKSVLNIKKCKERQKKYRNSKHGRRKRLDSYYIKNYNITLDEYDQLFENQGGVCALCEEPELGRRLAVDHNHVTGLVRKLLCSQCNCLVGFIEKKNIPLDKIRKYMET
jgi:hypothetical protein